MSYRYGLEHSYFCCPATLTRLVQWYSRLRSGSSLCLGGHSTVWLWLCPGPANTAVAARAARAMPALQLYIMSACQDDSNVIIVCVCVRAQQAIRGLLRWALVPCCAEHLCVHGRYAQVLCIVVRGTCAYFASITGVVPRSRCGPARRATPSCMLLLHWCVLQVCACGVVQSDGSCRSRHSEHCRL